MTLAGTAGAMSDFSLLAALGLDGSSWSRKVFSVEMMRCVAMMGDDGGSLVALRGGWMMQLGTRPTRDDSAGSETVLFPSLASRRDSVAYERVPSQGMMMLGHNRCEVFT